MLKFFARVLLASCSFLWCVPSIAKEFTVAFELPHFDTADYNKPYVAIWKESPKGNEGLLLWHLDRRQEDKWLVDIRRWWRKLGRYGDMPDGYTGATRGPGKYKEKLLVSDDTPFTLFVEVVREDGGRSLLRQEIDFSSDHSVIRIPAEKEIGEFTITIGNIE